jgi:tripartite-type tricarboxylate transporter receptor subunit TctC
LIAPTGLPQPAVAKLYAATKTSLANRQVQDALAAQGIVVIGTGPDVAPQFFIKELEKHTKLVKQSGAVAE